MDIRSRKAFTLIELLVVVAIIVILVAILIPALDAAMRASKFAACGAHQRGIGSGMNTYAMNNRQRYPKRESLEQYAVFDENTASWADGVAQQPGALKLQLIEGSTYIEKGGNVKKSETDPNWGDDRLTYKDYMGLELFEDPFSDEIGVKHPTTYERGRAVVASGDMWWDTGFKAGQKLSTMRDSLNWDNPVNGESTSIPLLAGDRSLWRDGQGLFRSSHPDRAGRLINLVRQDEPDGLPPYAYIWIGYWRDSGAVSDSIRNGTVFDKNYLFTDGSVDSYRGISQRVDEANRRAFDERFVYMPGFTAFFGQDASYVNDWNLLPRR